MTEFLLGRRPALRTCRASARTLLAAALLLWLPALHAVVDGATPATSRRNQTIDGFPVVPLVVDEHGPGDLSSLPRSLSATTVDQRKEMGPVTEDNEAVVEPFCPHCGAAANCPFWMISVRGMPLCHLPPEQIEPRCSRFSHQDGWREATLDDFFATDDPDIPTIISVHGARTSESEAVVAAHEMLRQLVANGDQRPCRFLLWSWPAAKTDEGALAEFRAQTVYSDYAGLALARVLDTMDPDVPVSLVGYSLGARVICAALHALGEGRVRGRALEEPSGAAGRRIRAVLLAAAMDNDSLLPGRRFGRALEQAEMILITHNPHDRVLRWYPFIDRRRAADALGKTGVLSSYRLGERQERILYLDVRPWVGKSHGWDHYSASGLITAWVAPFSFGEVPIRRRPPTTGGYISTNGGNMLSGRSTGE